METERERILRLARDLFFPGPEIERIGSVLTNHWRDRIGPVCEQAIRVVEGKRTTPERSEIGHILSIISAKVSGSSFTKPVRSVTLAAVRSAYEKGGREVQAEAYDQTKSVRKDRFDIQVVDGMSEIDAIARLNEQLIIAAGDFWDSKLQLSLQEEMQSWFEAEITREELSEKFKKLVNKRLRSEGNDTLGDSYFDRLSHYSIVKTRTISKYAKGKALQAKGYKLINPLDARTSTICKTLVKNGSIYPLEAAQPIINDLLTATTTEDIKESQPFWKSPDEDRIPMPPLHWGDCRTTIRLIFI